MDNFESSSRQSFAYGSPLASPAGFVSNQTQVGSGRRVTFVVDNHRTQVVGADPWILHQFDLGTRYPGEFAQAIEEGWAPPETLESGWDGWVRLLNQPKTIPPWVLTGLWPILDEIARSHGYQVITQETRERPPEGFPELGPIPLRDYQREAVEAALSAGRGVLDMPPRSGKTRTMCELHRQIALPALWTAPTSRIVIQTHKVLEEWFGKNYAYRLEGSKKWEEAAQHQVVVCTAATAVNLPQEFYATRQMLAVDEWHHGAATTYRKIFRKCPHIFYRYGMTGTFFRSGDDTLAMQALLSRTLYRVTPKFLMDRGHLVPTRVVFLPVLAPRLTGLPGTTFITSHGKFGIHEHNYRNQLVSYAAVTLWQYGRKVLVLVGTKAQGRTLQKMMTAYMPANRHTQFEAVEFISTDMARKKQGKILDAYLESDEVKILIGTSILGEGVDLPTVDALVYAKGEKAEVSLVQNAYRVRTALEGKAEALIVDFADRHNARLMRHSQSRMKTYWGDDTFQTGVLQDPHQFGAWLGGQHDENIV